MYYSNGFKNSYEELITYYPVFYRDVFEMRAILEAEGYLADNAIAGINGVIENCFINTADENMITRLEAFLGITTEINKPLEERRQLVYSFFIGFGKMSATQIKATIKAFTDADCTVKFKPIDEAGNNALIIEIDRGENEKINYADIDTVLSKKIPAHIAYKPFIRYRAAAAVKAARTKYPIEYRLCGLEPEPALLGNINNRPSATETNSAGQSYGVDYLYCGTALSGVR